MFICELLTEILTMSCCLIFMCTEYHHLEWRWTGPVRFNDHGFVCVTECMAHAQVIISSYFPSYMHTIDHNRVGSLFLTLCQFHNSLEVEVSIAIL